MLTNVNITTLTSDADVNCVATASRILGKYRALPTGSTTVIAGRRLPQLPRLDVKALQRVMMAKNFLFKHQLANAVGLSYEHLTAILARNENEVEEDVVAKLCAGLGCKRSDIVANE